MACGHRYSMSQTAKLHGLNVLARLANRSKSTIHQSETNGRRTFSLLAPEAQFFLFVHHGTVVVHHVVQVSSVKLCTVYTHTKKNVSTGFTHAIN